ncbi:MAG: CAP domain-containing protein [Nitriliruptor sp.]|uniref:CAP domain-containing protein n=1 Tax=Nitriliruptor sp. TaxID=2448056 RepID=UPI0034A0925C
MRPGPADGVALPAVGRRGEHRHGYTDAAEVHVGWMRSAGHRDHILYPGFTAIGIGVVCRNDGRMWATQIFGIPRDSNPDPPTPTTEEPVTRQDSGPACLLVGRWRLSP